MSTATLDFSPCLHFRLPSDKNRCMWCQGVRGVDEEAFQESPCSSSQGPSLDFRNPVSPLAKELWD